MSTFFPYKELYGKFYRKPESYFLANFKTEAEAMLNQFFQDNGINATASIEAEKGEDGYMRFKPGNVATAMILMNMPAEEFAYYDSQNDAYEGDTFKLEMVDGAPVMTKKMEFVLKEKLIEG